jgi:hypothetical protein
MDAPAGRQSLVEGLNLHENRMRTPSEAVKLLVRSASVASWARARQPLETALVLGVPLLSFADEAVQLLDWIDVR